MVALQKIGRPTYRIYQLAWVGLDWIYPPHCGGCEKPFTRWCENCQQSLQLIEEPICERCGGITDAPGRCANCLSTPPSYYALRSCARYDGVMRNAIHRLKYKDDLGLGEILARLMVILFQKLMWEIDLIVPVPGSLARRKMRGYNQASLLAFPIALNCGIPYRPKALMKTRETPSQVGLSAAERHANVQDAFLAKKEMVAGKRILVIDDVTTSGATMEACARALVNKGARQVYGLTLARAVL